MRFGRNDGLGGIKGSAPLPHGTNGLYFGAGIMAAVAPWLTEAADGQVTFSSTPALLSKPTDGPVTLEQTVFGLNPSATYLLDFWTSGENIGSSEFSADGFFGLEITGKAMPYFAAPSGFGPTGSSQRYQVYFQPSATTEAFRWINWGHYSGPSGLSDELVLDDVILNQVEVPEPRFVELPGLFGPLVWWQGRVRKAQSTVSELGVFMKGRDGLVPAGGLLRVGESRG